jgi:Ca2+-binding RTX toxin-like protein
MFFMSADDDVIHTPSREAGNDTLYGGTGDDRIFIMAGNDTVEGGEGADSFFFIGYTGRDGEDGDVWSRPIGHDVVLGFEVGVDKFGISFEDLHYGEAYEPGFPAGQITEVNGDSILTYDNDTTITFVGATGITADDYFD